MNGGITGFRAPELDNNYNGVGNHNDRRGGVQGFVRRDSLAMRSENRAKATKAFLDDKAFKPGLQHFKGTK